MKTKLMLISLCSLFLLSSCEKSAQEKLAEKQLAEQEEVKSFKLKNSCAHEKNLNENPEAKKGGFKMSQECIDFLKKKDKK